MLLSVVLPTYNEKDNVPILYERLSKTLKDIDYEIIIVDDNSPDGTYEAALALSEKDKRVLPIKRIHERGLSSAVMRGFAAARGKYLAVMDADLQHDEAILLEFLKRLETGCDIVIGSRQVEGGGIENWSGIRKLISWGATFLAKLLLPHNISDPMSGFFALTRDTYDQISDKINPRGFKILLEVVSKAKKAKIEEVGFIFKPRIHGESKLTSEVMMQFLVALYDMRFGKIIPVRFIKFGIVGGSGFGINFGFLWLGKDLFYLPVDHFYDIEINYALISAIEISIITNFFLNNFWTFRDVRATGVWGTIRALFFFNTICVAGAFINYAVVMYSKAKWGFSIYLGNLFGVLAATAWNYLINVGVTWKRP